MALEPKLATHHVHRFPNAHNRLLALNLDLTKHCVHQYYGSTSVSVIVWESIRRGVTSGRRARLGTDCPEIDDGFPVPTISHYNLFLLHVLLSTARQHDRSSTSLAFHP